MCVVVFVSVCLFGMHYKIKNCCKRNYIKIISNISAYISPIRLRNVAGDLAGERVRVSGWGRTSDSKYSFIILHFNLKNYTYQNDCFKRGRNSRPSENFLVTLNTFSLYCDIQGLKISSALRQCYMNQPTCVVYTLKTYFHE